MRIKDGYVVRKIGDEYYAVFAGGETDAPSMLSLNGVGAFLFEKLMAGADRETVIRAVVDTYEVMPEKAAADVDAFLEKLTRAGVLL